MQDFKDILKEYKEKMEKEINADTMEMLEQINPKITSDSKRYKEGNKYIFKQTIGYENSEDIFNAVSSFKDYNVYNLSEYKDIISQKIIYTFEQSENPIEILIYSTRSITSEAHRNAILDVIKDVVLDYRSNIIEAYKNILLNWTWQDCIELVLRSIEQNILTEMSDVVYEIFTENYTLREKTSATLVGINAENKFESMINFLVVTTGDSTDDINTLRRILYNIGKNTTKGSAYIYKVYSTVNCRNQISNALILGIKLNLSKAIFDDIERRLINGQLDRRYHNKLILLLERTKDWHKVSLDILQKCAGYKHLDQGRVSIAIGNDDIDNLIHIVTNDSGDERHRVKAVTNIGKSSDPRVNDILKSVYNKSDLLRIAAASALVERGDSKELLVLFKYLVGSSSDSDIFMETTNQIKRLISSSNDEIREAITKVVAKFMENNEAKSTERTLRILDLYLTGRPREEIGVIFLKKLKESPYTVIKSRLLTFFSKNYTMFSESLKIQIREEITVCSKIQEISEQSMEALKVITAGVTSLPDTV